MKRYLIFLCLCLLLFSSCEYFRYHPYEDVSGCERQLTQKNISLIERFGRGKDTLRFAFLSDTQRRYNDTRDAIQYVNQRKDIDFLLHGGDLTDFGVTAEFEWMYQELSKLKIPYLTVIGNHDFLGTGEHQYQEVFGPYNYSLNIGHLHIVVLNTSSREQDYTISVPDFDFLLNDIHAVSVINENRPDSITHTVIMMHARPGDEQFNNNVSIPFARFIVDYPGLDLNSRKISAEDIDNMTRHCSKDGFLSSEDKISLLGSLSHGFCLNGHNHRHELLHVLNNETLFFGVPGINKRELYVFTIHPDGYDYESIIF